MNARVAAVRAGDVRAVARLMRDLDDRVAGARESLSALYAGTGRAFVVGVTGAPGVGKSKMGTLRGSPFPPAARSAGRSPAALAGGVA